MLTLILYLKVCNLILKFSEIYLFQVGKTVLKTIGLLSNVFKLGNLFNDKSS